MAQIRTVLASSNYVIYNATLAKNLSVNSAIILGYFLSIDGFFKDTDKSVTIDGKKCFSVTRDIIYNNTGITVDQQKTVMNILKEVGILEVIKKDMPAKNYYYINVEVLETFLETKTSEDNNSGGNEIKSVPLFETKQLTKQEIKNQQQVEKKQLKAKKIKELFDHTRERTDNKDLIKALDSFLAKKLNYSGFNLDSWKLILDDLFTYIPELSQIELVNTATAANWKLIVYDKEKYINNNIVMTQDNHLIERENKKVDKSETPFF